MIDEQSVGQNYQIRGNHEKTLKFVEVAQICEYRNAREKFTVLHIISNQIMKKTSNLQD